MDNTNKLLNILDFSQVLLERLQIPLYSKQHSGKTFNNHQLFKLIVLKSYFGKDYRRFIEFLEVSEIPKLIGLKRIPHFTTLQKFSARQKIQELEQLILESCSLAKKKCKNVGIDATGMSLDFASKHYAQRIEKPILRRDFLKLNMFMDLDNLMILSAKIRKKARHDTKDVKALWNKIKHLLFRKVFADKGYDADFFHEIVYKSGRKSVIFIKNPDVPIWRTKGTFRKMAKKDARNHQKGKRSLTETVNSILKRVYGETIAAKKLCTQKIELLFRILTLNLERLSILIEKIFLLFFIFLRKRLFGAKSTKQIIYFYLL
ncbi:MAG TPA: IS5 family transposase [Candidatus Nanoarchaeia archaeon]|nr:IS5 family transposase [Candidatus Nanoarchaeia archaeon]